MSSQLKEVHQQEESQDFYSSKFHGSASKNSRVNLNDLVNRLNLEKKKERKSNIILTVAAVSAVSVFGIILTLWNFNFLYELVLLRQLNKIH